jgi:hypothetical protein
MILAVLDRVRKLRAMAIGHLPKKTRLLIDFTVLMGMLVSLTVVTNVPTRVTETDAEVFRDVLGLSRQQLRPGTFEEEIALIRSVQGRVLAAAPIDVGIPQFDSREPADLFRLGYGLCYDRSRAIDKALKFEGLRPVTFTFCIGPESRLSRLC